MTIKTRLAKAEKANRAAESVEIRVWLTEGGYCERRAPDGQLIERISEAELDARAAASNDTVIKVSYDEDGEKITDFGRKRYIGFSPLDWDK